MAKLWRLFVVAVAVLLVGCDNILLPFANTTSDDANFYQAQMDINSGQYSTAITLIQSLSSTYLSQRSVQDVYASAYAGLCQLDLLKLAGELSSLSGNLFVVLLQGFDHGTTTIIGYCQAAQNIIEGISTNPAQLTPDENVLLAFVELATIGNIMSYVADPNHTGNPQSSFNQCANPPLTDNLVAQVGVSMAIASLSLAQVGASIGGAGATAITSICSALPAGYCNLTNISDWTAAEITTLRGLIAANQGMSAGSSTIGLATCNGTITTCASAPGC